MAKEPGGPKEEKGPKDLTEADLDKKIIELLKKRDSLIAGQDQIKDAKEILEDVKKRSMDPKQYLGLERYAGLSDEQRAEEVSRIDKEIEDLEKELYSHDDEYETRTGKSGIDKYYGAEEE